MFDIGGGELLFIIVIALMLFGPKKIPETARMLGKGLRQFRKAQEDLTQHIRNISADSVMDKVDKATQINPPSQETYSRSSNSTPTEPTTATSIAPNE